METSYISLRRKYRGLPVLAAYLGAASSFVSGYMFIGESIIAGLLAATFSEGVTEHFLRNRGYDRTYGSKLLRRVQFACAAASVCIGAGLEYKFHDYESSIMKWITGSVAYRESGPQKSKHPLSAHITSNPLPCP